jgi:hypothetical protein
MKRLLFLLLCALCAVNAKSETATIDNLVYTYEFGGTIDDGGGYYVFTITNIVPAEGHTYPDTLFIPLYMPGNTMPVRAIKGSVETGTNNYYNIFGENQRSESNPSNAIKTKNFNSRHSDASSSLPYKQGSRHGLTVYNQGRPSVEEKAAQTLSVAGFSWRQSHCNLSPPGTPRSARFNHIRTFHLLEHPRPPLPFFVAFSKRSFSLRPSQPDIWTTSRWRIFTNGK